MNQVNGVDMLTETEERRIDMILAKIDLENVRGELVERLPAFFGVSSLEEVEEIIALALEDGDYTGLGRD